MDEVLRTVRVAEFDPLMRFLERSYGQGVGSFEDYAPRLYQRTPEACASAYVIERDGRILSHVGLYAIETVTTNVSLTVGGIGGVGTLPDERGKGYMSRLLRHVIGEMRERGYPISWLGGDRQRYNAFGWEQAGCTYYLDFSRRSLDRAGVEPVSLQERRPSEAVETIARYQSLAACHARRPYLALQICRQRLRTWITEDGYAVVRAPAWQAPTVIELVSASGREAGMIRALMDWTFQDQFTCLLSAWDRERLAHILPAAMGWHIGGGGMYRIVDLGQLLQAAKGFLDERAANLRDFELSIGIREEDRTQVTTLVACGGSIEVSPGRQAETYVELSPITAARLFVGGGSGRKRGVDPGRADGPAAPPRARAAPGQGVRSLVRPAKLCLRSIRERRDADEHGETRMIIEAYLRIFSKSGQRRL